jgi:hypothetical protein
MPAPEVHSLSQEARPIVGHVSVLDDEKAVRILTLTLAQEPHG